MAGVYLALAAIVLFCLGLINIVGAGTSHELREADEEFLGFVQLLVALVAVVAAVNATRRRRPAMAPLLVIPMLFMATLQSLYGEQGVSLSIIVLGLLSLYLVRKGRTLPEARGPAATAKVGAGAWPLPGDGTHRYGRAMPGATTDDGYGYPVPVPPPRPRVPGARSLAAAGVLILIVGFLMLMLGVEGLEGTYVHTSTYRGGTDDPVEGTTTFSLRNLVMGLLFTSSFLLCSKGAFHALSRTDHDSALWLPLTAPGACLLGCFIFGIYFVFLVFLPVAMMSVAAFLLVSQNLNLFVIANEAPGTG